MKKLEFTNPKTGHTYKRVSKQKAKKLFADGHTLIIAPCNFRLFTMWGGFSTMNKCDSENPEFDFNRIINAYTYYNCNNEVGKYPSFYVTENLA